MRNSYLHSLAALLLPLALSVPASARAVESRDVNVGWPYGSEKIRGVNIGGWLVLEPFITPSLFENTANGGIVDEWTFSQYQDYDTAHSALVKHWNSWYTEDDFRQIAAAGLNHVRIPIGFWAYDVSGGEPYIQGQAAYLDKAIGWARNHGLKVIVDLHGAPGSQNGYDNSGHRGDPHWQDNASNVARTKNVIQSLSQKYSDPSYWQVVTALGLLNEPATYVSSQLLSTTRQYWYDAYGASRYPWAPEGSGSKSGLALIIHDGFQPLSTFDNYMPYPSFEDVFIDTHNYQVFNDDFQTWTWPRHLQGICDQASNYASSPLWLMVGEWSLATTDCAPSLNGRGIGARYDGSYSGSSYVGDCRTKSGDGSSFSQEYKDFMREFYDAQVQTYENNAQGWIHWTWKTEAAADWSYSAGLAGGWIPYDPTNHQHSIQSICG
ncbi:putative cellulase [Naematelia encephala]|uniref:glucan 1,3-beta-glucosidase n=1 Tax=Naematelia encephala TaxID=71784 RepID=A0A1Y2BLK5_9TREE|nr:putative cellulase [Naematelia encephala]